MTKNIITWICVLLIVIMSTSVTAIGVSPIRHSLDFEPGKNQEFTIKIKNDADVRVEASVSARGELEDYIHIINKKIKIEPRSTDYAKYKVRLPEYLEPGTHKAEIVVSAKPVIEERDISTIVTAQTSVASGLRVSVPYPEKFAEAKQFIRSGNVNEEVEFVINVINLGNQEIDSARGDIKILDPEFQQVDDVPTEPLPVRKNDYTKLRAKWQPSSQAGKFFANTEIDYDGKKLALQQAFTVGKLSVDIFDINIEDFSLGEIAVFNIIVSSNWNDHVSGVHADIEVFDAQGKSIDRFDTASLDLPPDKRQSIKAYWDTAGIKEGTYILLIKLYYEGLFKELSLQTTVTQDEIITDFISGDTVGPVDKPALTGNLTNGLLILALILLIFVNVAWFGYMIYSRVKGKI